MRKIGKTSELLWLFGVLFVALGVAICSKANLGVSMIAAPAFIVHEALSVWQVSSVGMMEYIIQGLLLIVLCLLIGRFRWRFLLAFAVAVIYGYALNLFIWLLGGVSFDTIPVRWIMLIVGDVCTAFGVACFFRTYLPLEVYELFVAELAARFRLKINKTKWCFDITLLVLSIVLSLLLFRDLKQFNWSTIGYANFHSIGPGTFVTTAINSPIIALMGRLIDRLFDPTPRFPALEAALKRS